MWIALKDFYYRGKLWKRGDEVPAASWPGRSALTKLRRIHFVSQEVVPPSPVDITKLKRGDLNVHAASLGIENPSEHPNRESLIAAITNLTTGESTGNAEGNNSSAAVSGAETEDSGTSGSTNPPEDPVDSSGGLPIVEDDLFADPPKSINDNTLDTIESGRLGGGN